MSDKEHDFRSLVCIYAQLLPVIRAAAKEMGYAVAIHGTMQRDLDLLAVPWVEDAKPAKELVSFVAQAVDGFVIGDLSDRGKVSDEPTIQPHGRLSWNICWGGNPFIDLSVMPLVRKSSGWNGRVAFTDEEWTAIRDRMQRELLGVTTGMNLRVE